MTTIKKTLAALLAGLTAALSLPTAVTAASAQVEDLDGVRTVFVSNFGRLTYNGTAFAAFRTPEEAYAALGNEGGRIVFTGTMNLSAFPDEAGRGALTFEGCGNKLTSSILLFDETVTAVELKGDTYLDNCILRTQPEVPVYTNGYSFETSDRFNSYYVENYVSSGNNTITYVAPFTFATGTLISSGTSAKPSVLRAGKTGLLVGGSHGGKNLQGNTSFEIAGGTVALAVAGNADSAGTFSGTSHLTISGGTVEKAVLGSESGVTNANLILSAKGGEIKELILGSSSVASPVNGNVVLMNDGAAIGKVTTAPATVKGVIIAIDRTGSLALEEGDCNYRIRAKDTTVVPVFNGTSLAGFRITDKNNFIPAKVFADGQELTHTNGIFQLPAGSTTVTCESSAAVEVNKNASFVAGYQDGTFQPQKNLTRAEAITLLSRILCADISRLSEIASCDYEDVSTGDWYYGTVAFFQNLGYLDKLEGLGGSTISPNASITRGEFAELCLHVIKEMYDGREFGFKAFSDVPSSSPFYSSIGQLGYLGISVGYEDGTFLPDKTITRAEVVTMVNRFLGRTPTGSQGEVTFSDVDGHWAKHQIAAACNPAESAGNTVWTVTEDITQGHYDLLEGDVTVGDQIRALREKMPSLAEKDILEGIDQISKWQIRQIVNAKDIPDREGGKTFYISPNGNDENDGLSPETAWQTLNRLQTFDAMRLLKAGDTVRFERGGEWRGTLICRPGVNYGAYGTGSKPILNASKKNYADASLWTETDVPNVYKCTDRLDNVGIIVYNYSGVLGNYEETVGFLQVVGVDGFTGYKDLYKDLTFCSDLNTGELYVCSTGGNPGTRFQSMEIGANVTMLSVQEPGNVTVDNLTFRFTGGHAVAIGDKENVTVQNCTFDYLGGSILKGFGGANVTRYGNALQVYGGCDGWYLYNNWMYQIYDTGVTHQYNSYASKGPCLMDNVKYIGNVVELCHWSIEYYNPDYEKTKHTFHNTYIADNICRLNGYGWGSQIRQSTAYLFQSAGIPKDTKNFVTENNIFDRASGRIFNVWSDGDRKLELRDNLYVQNANGEIGNFFGATVRANASAPSLLAKNAKDSTSRVLINNDITIRNDLINP